MDKTRRSEGRRFSNEERMLMYRRVLEEIARMKPENRPLDLYAALAEAAADRERRRA